jgi:hypothetical protein
MKRNWEDIKWIFTPDGSLRDIYVQDVSISDWEQLIDFLNENYQLEYGIVGEERNKSKIDKREVVEYLTNETAKIYGISTAIDLGGIQAICHFFLLEQIEFDIAPREISSVEDFEKVEKFMQSISWNLGKQVTLTDEDTPEFPYIKVDVTRNINKVLTLKEAQALLGNENTSIDPNAYLEISLEMEMFPEKFYEQVLKSACEAHTPTKRNKNIW